MRARAPGIRERVRLECAFLSVEIATALKGFAMTIFNKIAY